MENLIEQINKFKIVQISGVSTWKWQDCTDRCAICRNYLREPSIDFQSKKIFHNQNNYEDKLLISVGNCEHSFHLDCIEKWLHKNQKCPLCAKFWKYNKVFDINQWK